MKLAGAICFLVVNEIRELPEVAVKSALANSECDIYIGFTKFSDVDVFINEPRVHLMPLGDVQSENRDTSYQDFSTTAFYQIVQLKWKLIQKLLPRFDYLIYSDIDVVWIQDANEYITKTFTLNPDVDFLVQGFTEIIGEDQLCMGFAAFRNTQRALKFVEECERQHELEARESDSVGDDEIVTAQYKLKSRPSWIQELPQMYFPVGKMLNLYSTYPKIPGLLPPDPYVFHLNYVIGLRNKRLMLRMLRKNKKLKKVVKWNYWNYWVYLLILKKFRLFIGQTRRDLFK